MAVFKTSANVKTPQRLDAENPLLACYGRRAGKGKRGNLERFPAIVDATTLGDQGGHVGSFAIACADHRGIEHQAVIVGGRVSWLGEHFGGLLFWDTIIAMHAGKLQTIGNSLGIILPRQQLREAGWSKGDYIAVEFDGKEFNLHRVRDIHTRFTTRDGRARGTGNDSIPG